MQHRGEVSFPVIRLIFQLAHKHDVCTILRMMHIVASHTTENRMTPSTVATCMSPLLLRPLLAGECEMEDDIDMIDDNSAELIAAANANIGGTRLAGATWPTPVRE